MSDDGEQKIGPILDGLDVTVHVAEGEFVTDALVLAKVLEPDGCVRLVCCSSAAMSWIEKLGMLHAALAFESPAPGSGGDDD